MKPKHTEQSVFNKGFSLINRSHLLIVEKNKSTRNVNTGISETLRCFFQCGTIATTFHAKSQFMNAIIYILNLICLILLHMYWSSWCNQHSPRSQYLPDVPCIISTTARPKSSCTTRRQIRPPHSSNGLLSSVYTFSDNCFWRKRQIQSAIDEHHESL